MGIRKLKRRHLLFYLPVVEEGSGETIGRVADLTEEGMMLLSDVPIEIGRELELTVIMPEPTDTDETVSFLARSLWTSPDANPALHNTGFRFTRITPGDAATIRRLIDRFGFSD